MKVAVISRHSVANYGSLWQAYALQTAIEKLGIEAVNINYTPAGEVAGNLAKTLVNQSRWSKNPLTKLLFLAYQYPSFTHTFHTFEKFRKSILNETKTYTSSSDLAADLPDADIFCTGSDQVWNVLYDGNIDDTYFLDFLPDGKRRIAYAASFGGNKFENNDTDKYRNYLKRYDSISVREDSGIEILKGFGIDGKQVLDPTLLLGREDWENLLPPKEKKEDYILIYQLRPNKDFDNYAVELSNRTGLKLVRISTMLFQKMKCGEFHYIPDPGEFLWYIKNATCLLTDSFHGTCFAINFNTQFIEILPGRFNARNQSLLRAMGVEDRILTDFQNYELFSDEINWYCVNNLLNQNRHISKEILANEIKG